MRCNIPGTCTSITEILADRSFGHIVDSERNNIRKDTFVFSSLDFDTEYLAVNYSSITAYCLEHQM